MPVTNNTNTYKLERGKLMKIINKLITVLLFSLFINTQSYAMQVDLQLQLMIDVSNSISQSEFELQRQGYANAFKSTSVQNAITSLTNGIAVSVAYFSTTASGATVSFNNPKLSWVQLSTALDADNFGTSILSLTEPDPMGGGDGKTNIADAIQFGIGAFNNNGFDSARRVIDVSTDGVQNVDLIGVTDNCLSTAQLCTDVVVAQRAAAETAGITVNGLAILGAEDTSPFAALGTIDQYLAAFAITSDGFVVSADNLTDLAAFEAAITEKLTREISGTIIPLPAAVWLFGSSLIALLGLTRRRTA